MKCNVKRCLKTQLLKKINNEVICSAFTCFVSVNIIVYPVSQQHGAVRHCCAKVHLLSLQDISNLSDIAKIDAQ